MSYPNDPSESPTTVVNLTRPTPVTSPPAPKRPWWKRKWGIAAIVVVALFVLGSISNAVNPRSAGSTASADPTPLAVIHDPSTSPSSTAAATADPVETPEPAVEATVEPTAKPTAIPVVLKISGRGDKVVKMNPQDEPTFAKITGKGGGNFSVISYTGSEYGDLLVNEIGSYSGTVYIAAGINRLKVSSSGSWTIEVRSIQAAPRWDGSKALAGKGDRVVLLSNGGAGITTIKNKGRDNFAIIAYSLSGEYLDLVVNEIGSYSGEVLLPDEDPMVLSIHDVGGTWSMSAVGQ